MMANALLTNLNNSAQYINRTISNNQLPFDDASLTILTRNKYSDLVSISGVNGLYESFIKRDTKIFDTTGIVDYFGNATGTYAGEISINGTNYWNSISTAGHLQKVETLTEGAKQEEIVPFSDLGYVYCEHKRFLGSQARCNLLAVNNGYLYYLINDTPTSNSTIYKQRIDGNFERDNVLTLNVNLWHVALSSYKFTVNDNEYMYAVDNAQKNIYKISLDRLDDIELRYTSTEPIEQIFITPYRVIASIPNENKITSINKSSNSSISTTYNYGGLPLKTFHVEPTNGHILLATEMYKTDTHTNYLSIWNPTTQFSLLSLTITSSSVLWSRISGDVIVYMAVDKDKNLWIVNYDSVNDRSYLTKVATTSSGIGAKQWETRLPSYTKPMWNREMLMFPDTDTGSMYFYYQVLAKYSTTNGDLLAFNSYIGESFKMDATLNNKIIYHNYNSAYIQAFRDNTYGTKYTTQLTILND